MSLLGPISTLGRWREEAFNVDFLAGRLPVGATLSRAGSALYWDADGRLRTAGENEPQFEYDANGRPCGLLLEPQSTNMVNYSNDALHSSWVVSGATKTGGYEAPDGKPTGVRIDPVGGSVAGLYKGFTLSPIAASITLSVYIKPIPGQVGQLAFTMRNDTRSTTVSPYGYFSTETMSVSGGTEFWSVQKCPRGWYRMIGVFPTTSYQAGDQLRFYWGSTSASPRPAFIVHGMQAEARANATSLIPTAELGGVSRALSMLSIPTPLFYRADVGGALLIEAVPLGPPAADGDLGYLAVMNDGTNSNRVGIYTRRDSGGVFKVQAVVTTGGSTIISTTSPTMANLYDGRPLKMGVNFGASGAESWVNGTAIASSTSSALPVAPTVLELRKTGQTGFYYRTLRYYDKAVDMATLTAR